jgi:6-pyruvoyltetrahydropterin/6-carboxytetrahydropterin synthase
MERYRIRITNDRLAFSAGHFITLEPEVCESLHGHDYRVSVELGGPLDENQYVVDFIAVERTLEGILRELDHAVLLPTQHPQIRVSAGADQVEVRFGDRRWSLPRGDCRLLEIPNTTTELLARLVGQRLLEELARCLGFQPESLQVEIRESTGQGAIWELSESV